MHAQGQQSYEVTAALPSVIAAAAAAAVAVLQLLLLTLLLGRT
jgi:hypothetical protein